MRLFLTICFVSLFVGAGRADGAGTPSPAGRIAGKFSVDRDGAAVYEIPIEVPPGIRNSEPKLSVTYSSQRRNGRLGVGWDLSGLSAIGRCPANLAVDGFKGGVTYGPDDRFCLDGERLILTGCEAGVADCRYGAARSIYRTEIESWRTVVAGDRLCGAGPCSFTVTAKKGTVTRYGASTGRILAAGLPDVRVWAMDDRTDLHGNATTYVYSTDPLLSHAADEDYYLSEVRYTSNPENGVAANRFVKLCYEARPDPERRYQGGAEVVTSARLTHVTTYLEAASVQDYRLAYDVEAPSLCGAARPPVPLRAQRSRLTGVSLCDGTTATAACLPPTEFTWQNSAVRFDGATVALPNAFGEQSEYQASIGLRELADVDGDGRADIVGFSPVDQTTVVALSQGTTFGTPQVWNSPAAGIVCSGFGRSGDWGVENTPRMLADVNGDGRADLVGFSTQGVCLGLSTGSSFEVKDPNQPFPYFNLANGYRGSVPRLLSDVNGDGRADIVGFIDNVVASGVQVALSNGESFADPTIWSGDFVGSRWNGKVRALADIDGDGLADLVGFDDKGVHVALAAPRSGAFVEPSWSPVPIFISNWPTSDSLLTFADLNGDGLTDIVGVRNDGAHVALATGTGFEPPELWLARDPGWSATSSPIYLADANADGKADLLIFGVRHVTVGLSTGGSFDTATWDQDSLDAFTGPDWGTLAPRRVADVNGDGLIDALGFGFQNVEAGIATGPYPDLLSTATDGLGRTVAVTYLPISDPSVYSPAADLLPAEGPQGDGDPASPQAVPALANNSLAAARPYPVPGATLASAAPLRDVLGGRGYVVAGYEIRNDPAVNDSAFRYDHQLHYAAAEIDLGGRGWLGYREVRRTDGETGRVGYDTYAQAFPLTGRRIGRLRRCGAGSPAFDPKCTASGLELDGQAILYGAVATATGPGNGPKVYDVRKRTFREDRYDYGTYAYSLGRQWDYDAYGNVERHSYLGFVSRGWSSPCSAYPCPGDLPGYGDADDDVFTLTRYVAPPGGVPSYLGLRKLSKSPLLDNLQTFDPVSDLSLHDHDYDIQVLGCSVDPGRMNLGAIRRWDDTHGGYLIHAYCYDAFGNRTAVIDPAAHRTVTTFDPAFHTYPQTRTSPKNDLGVSLVQWFAYDPRFGRQVAQTGPNGTVSPEAYKRWTRVRCLDNFGRLSAVQGPPPDLPQGGSDVNCVPAQAVGPVDVGAAMVVTLSQHALKSESGRIYRESDVEQLWPTSNGERDTVVHRAYVDALLRTYRGTRSTTAKTIQIDTAHDEDGRTISQTLPYFEGDPSYPATARYDVYGRLTEIRRPAIGEPARAVRSTRSYSLFPQGDSVVLTFFSDSGGSSYSETVRQSLFYGKSRAVSMTVAAEQAVTSYGYDRLGRSTSATDPAGLATRASYDSLGRYRLLHDQAHGDVSFGYDLKGRLETKTDGNGTFTFQYDDLGRLSVKTLPAAAEAAVYFHYDQPDRRNGLGQRTSIEVRSTNAATRGIENCSAPTRGGGPAPQGLPQPLSCTSYDFDKYGNKEGTTLVVADADAVRTFHSSDLYGPTAVAASHTWPDGSVLQWKRKQGELQQILLDDVLVASYSGYDPGGRAETVALGNGLVETGTYSLSGPLLSQSVGRPGGDDPEEGAGSSYLDLAYQWDDLGELTRIDDRAKAEVDYTQELDYKNLRLASASSDGNLYPDQTFEHEPSGNLRLKGDVTYHYDGHQASYGCSNGAAEPSADEGETDSRCDGGTEVFSADYSPVGNMIRKQGTGGSWSYAYDVENRLLRAEGGSVSTTYSYDWSGRRLLKVEPGGRETLYVDPTYFVTSLDGAVQSATRSIGSPETSGVALAAVTKASGATSGEIRYFHRNHLRSVLLTTDGEGKPATYVSYDPFGKTTLHGAGDFRPKYNGKELESATGLYDYGARTYDPEIGHFLTADTGLGAGKTRQDTFNRYQYALGSPTVFSDPTGKAAVCPIATGVSGALGGLVGGGLGWATTAEHKGAGAAKDGLGMGLGAAGLAAGICYAVEARTKTATIRQLQEDNDAWRQAYDDLREEYAQVREDNTYLQQENDALRSYSGQYYGTSCCFAAGTEVSAEAGPKAIEDVRPGDRVWSWNERLGIAELKPVLRLIRNPKGGEEEIRLSIAGSEIVATPGHPFWSEDDHLWKRAGDLKVGERLRSRSGEVVELEAIERRRRHFLTFNFEVADNHDYFVGAAEVLVHNASSCSLDDSESTVGEEDGLGNSTEMGSGEVTADADLGADLAAEATSAVSSESATAATAATATSATSATAATTAGTAAAEATAAGAEAAADAEVAADIVEILLGLLLVGL